MHVCVCMQDLFQPLELQAMVVGNENYDWDELEKVSCAIIVFIDMSDVFLYHTLLLV